MSLIALCILAVVLLALGFEMFRVTPGSGPAEWLARAPRHLRRVAPTRRRSGWISGSLLLLVGDLRC